MADIIQIQDSRREFIDVLCELAEMDSRVVFIVPDVGFNYADKFANRFPDRYFNLGVTEASTILIAAAMALSGLRPYVYSMINFVAFRPFEMVRNGIALHHANVKLLGVSGSEKYKFLGFSHGMVFDNEDEYHLSPYMRCFFPRGNEEVRTVIETSYTLEEPCYIRL